MIVVCIINSQDMCQQENIVFSMIYNDFMSCFKKKVQK